jgi:multiple sugar transport system permease protein
MSATSRVVPVAERTRARRSKPKTRIHPFLFVAPSVLMLALLLVLPIGQAFLRTFQSDAGWGVDNYVRAVRDDHLARLALRHTFLFALFSVIGQYLIGFAVALLLNERMPLRGMFRVLFLLPWMFPAVVPGITWRWIFDGLFGVLNELLYRIHYYDQNDVPIAWLGQTSTALAATVVANVWRGFPFMMVLLLAGLQAVNAELYEAAAVDGASAWQRFRYVTWPGVRNLYITSTLLSTIWSLGDFNSVYLLTGGAPLDRTHTLATLGIKYGYQIADVSTGVATVITALPLVVPVIVYLVSQLGRRST